ncbi:MAG: protein phosphatase CheZ [Sterolibacterium sp.]|jgi:chemotaxis protein CheZ|nr:protein phosphatase CheZ [Sterolibacterium sp.]
MATSTLSPSRESAKFDESGDNDDLQTLFDSIAAASISEPPPSAKAVEPVADAFGDNADLQALFDSVSEQVGAGSTAASPAAAASVAAAAAVAPAQPAAMASEVAPEDGQSTQVFNRIGVMTRDLHNTLHELGYDRVLEDTARAIPDARQRLVYIAQMTEQAASRVLNATEIVRPIQDALGDRSKLLAQRWDKVFSNQLSPAEFKALAAETHGFLSDVPQQVSATNSQLTEIMMAQDFQDLTGQVIKKVVDLAQKMEQQLLSILLETMPPEIRAEMRIEAPDGLLNGPVVNSAGRTDIVNSQAQVDDLLESLGF